MFVQDIYIRQYDWNITIYYDVMPRDANRIINALYDMGCATHYLRYAEKLLKSGCYNQGLTYSDKWNKHSIIVVGRAVSIGQYINTLVHEVDHLVDHISQYYGIAYESEDNSYLIGDVAEAIYEDAIRCLMHNYSHFV